MVLSMLEFENTMSLFVWVIGHVSESMGINKRRYGNEDVVDCNSFYWMNNTWYDASVDIAHGLGKQRTSASVSFSCVSMFTFLILFCTYEVALQMDCSTIKG